MSNKAQEFLEFGRYRIDTLERILYSEGKEIPLAPKLFDTLLALVQNPGRIMHKDELMRTIWPDSFVEEGSLTRYVSTLRKTLGAGVEDQQIIQTIPKRGYRFVAEVRSTSAHDGVQIIQERGRLDASLDVVVEDEELAKAVIQAPSSQIGRWRRALLWAAPAIVLTAVALTLTDRRQPAPEAVMRLTMDLPAETELAGLQCPIVALSPQGNRVALVAARDGTTRLYVRELDSMEARALPGTEGAFCTPFFSPDGQWLGFVADAKLKKISVAGGEVIVLTALPGINGASWTTNGSVVFGQPGRHALSRIAATGGTVEPATTLDSSRGEISHQWPAAIVGTDLLLYQANIDNGEKYSEIVVQDLRRGKRQVIARGGTYPQYVPTGHVVYVHDGVMMAQTFDAATMQTTGLAFPVADNIMESGQGAAQFEVSQLGSLVYVPGGVEAGRRTLVWIDRKGNETPLAAPLQPYRVPRLSSDSERVTLSRDETFSSGWIYDLKRNTLMRANDTFPMNHPIWSPDAKRIAYFSNQNGRGIFWKAADGSISQERLTSTMNPQAPTSWSPDGRYLAFQEFTKPTGSDVWVLPLNGDPKPQPFLRTVADETTPMISPDGRWLAYASNESGRYEVYVQPFRGGGAKWQISNDGGHDPVWAKSSDELFYRSGDKMMAAEYQTSPTLKFGKPEVLFEKKVFEFTVAGVPAGSYDVCLDGQRFLMVLNAVRQPVRQVNVVVNWFEDVRRRLPAAD
jgi:serine/threonine-protein kinase